MFADPPLEGRGPRNVQFSGDGGLVAYLAPSTGDGEVLELFALDLAATPPVPVRVVGIQDLAGDRPKTEAERMVEERKRIRHRGITEYSFCGDAGRLLLVPQGGHLFTVDPTSTPPRVEKLTKAQAPRLSARCSPQGNWVSYVQDGAVHLLDRETGRTRRVSPAPREARSYGVAEFIAQEEMGRFDGIFWSTDERNLAYTDVDESDVPVKRRSQIHPDRTDVVEQRYPAAGEPNARVGLRVVDLLARRETVVKLPSEDGYLARVTFATTGDLWVQWQPRDQKRLVLLRGSRPSYELATVLTERDDAWVELHDDLRVLPDGRFVWPTESSGVRQFELVSPDGATRTALTKGSEPVMRIVAMDETSVFYLRTAQRGVARQLMRVTFDGVETPLTDDRGDRAVQGHRKGKAFAETGGRALKAPRTRVFDATGKELYIFPNDTLEWNATQKPQVLSLTVKADDGTLLNAQLLRPLSASSSRKAPVLLYVYGGPGVQVVKDGWIRPYLVYLAQHGVGVLMLDNRGTDGRDRKFTRAFTRAFGAVEVADQLAGARALATIDWVDSTRLAVFGWSYGGTLAAMLLFAPQSPFKAAISVAPVTDWRLYDTHYTERYLGQPASNAEAYERASVLSRVRPGAGRLFLIHGTADDNVLFEHSLKLANVLQSKGIAFDLMIYPGAAHGLRGRETQRHVYGAITEFLYNTLAAPDLRE